MSYLRASGRNWGVLVACLIGVPSGMAWSAICIVGGGLVCADGASHCAGVLWPLIQGTALIGAVTTAIAFAINLLIRSFDRGR